jgi:DNA-directed RNA polymerase subunit RPC12/RpoP
LCGSRLYARPDQIGHEITCPDCHFKVLVKAPKPRKAPTVVPDDEADFKLSEVVERPATTFYSTAEAAASQPPAPAEPPKEKPPASAPPASRNVMSDQARAVLQKARAEAEERERATPKLPDRPFVTGVISFLGDERAALQGVVLTLLLSGVVTFLTRAITLSQDPGGMQQFGALFFSMLVTVSSLALLTLSAVCYLAIFQDTANGYHKIENWPGMNVGDWLGQAFYVVNALLASAVPGILLGQAGVCVGGRIWLALSGGAVTFFVLFPIFLLSMLEEGSPLSIASAAIWRTLRTAIRLWLKIYLISAGIGCLVLLGLQVMVSTGFLLRTLVAGLITAALMVYFRLLGRLAWCLAERSAASDDKPASSP